jgi:hypothetical protein
MSCIDLITSCEGMNFQLAGFACYFRHMPSRKSVKASIAPVSVQLIERRIYLIRGHKVMIDVDLAEMYDVPTYRLNEAVKRNRRRFPKDFMFRLTTIEAGLWGRNLRPQRKAETF